MISKPLLAICAAGMVTLTLLAAIFAHPLEADDETSEAAGDLAVASQANPIGEPVYVLKEFEGKLAVFLNDEDSPYEVYDFFIHSLPDYDREQLKNGITAENMEILNGLLEDYTS